jgi:glycosyltransferase involved in cell wall biosynthesis
MDIAAVDLSGEAGLTLGGPPVGNTSGSRLDDRPLIEAATCPGMTVALLTPWNQQCGNAEFAKRLVVGLSRFARITPIELENLHDHDTLDTARKRSRYLDELIGQANAADTDLVHVQHEFCFFGRRIRDANHGFLRVMREIRKPVVLSLHTWSRGMSRKTHRSIVKQGVESVLHRLRNRAMKESLWRADAIILHSKDTRAQCLTVYPKLKKRLHLLPIPVEPVIAAGITAPFRKRPGERWILLPGFVSRYKGHRHLLEALRFLPEDHRVVFAGSVHPKDRAGHEYWSGLLAAIDAAGYHERVLFTGFLGDPAEQSAVLRQADAFVLPYDEVGQSGSAVLADALAHGKPVITSLARSMFVYRHDSDTVFSSVAIDVTDPEKLASAIIEATDPAGCPRRRLHQSTVCDRYSLARTAAGYEDVYRSVLEQRDVRKTA